MFKFLLLIFLIFVSQGQAYFQKSYNKNLVEKDIKAGKVAQYQTDRLPYFEQKQLVKKGVFTANQKLTRDDNISTFTPASIVSLRTCDNIGSDYTGTMYDVNLENGAITCMFAKTGDLYNPIGLFKVYYPAIKKATAKNIVAAKAANQSNIAAADTLFQQLQQTKNEIASSIETGANHLTLPQFLLASILTDPDVINIDATQATNRLQLRDNFTTEITNEEGTIINNADAFKESAINIFNTYSSLSEISMKYLMVLLAVFGGYGLVTMGVARASSGSEDKQQNKKFLLYMASMVGGILFLFPVNDHDNITNADGQTVGQYQIMKTRYQHFEKTGYYLFNDWGEDSAKVIIDNEMDSIITKSGLHTADSIINSYAGMRQTQKLLNFENSYLNYCTDTVFNKDDLKNSNNKSIYSETDATLFPHSESWAYAAAMTTLGAKEYYDPAPRGMVRESGYSPAVMNSAESLENYYPTASMSSCGKTQFKITKYKKLLNDYSKSYNKAIGNTPGANQKIQILQSLIRFQYTNLRDFGILSVLTLPVVSLQTEYLHGLYTPENKLLGLDKKIDANLDQTTHQVLSAIPYMLVPGMSTISRNINNLFRDLKQGASKSVFGRIGQFFGGDIALSIASNLTAFGIVVVITKTILLLAPMIAIIIFGLYRFIYIIIKIFSIHFLSLFAIPLAFLPNNHSYFVSFTSKVFSTFLELPIYVLSIWMAFTSFSLINGIGNLVSKRIIIGMLDNIAATPSTAGFHLTDLLSLNYNTANIVKVYILDGFFSIAISLFSIYLIYNIIITLHKVFFEMIELKTSSTLDDTLGQLTDNKFSGKI